MQKKVIHSKVHIHRDTLIELLKKYPDNRQEAFRQCSALINLKVSQVSTYYYDHIFHSNDIIGTVGSTEGFTSNRKNTLVKANAEFKREEPLSPLFIILENFMSLSTKEKSSLKRILDKL